MIYNWSSTRFFLTVVKKIIVVERVSVINRLTAEIETASSNIFQRSYHEGKPSIKE
jgi:DNA topoisomerase VI subunit A